MAAALPSEGMAARIEALRRITFVDVVLWGMRILIVFVVVGGTIGTLIQGRYTGEQWFDNFMFGLMIGGVYALIALGYTMVYGILRLINFAHGDVMMCGAFTSYFLANGLYRSGYLDAHPVISMILIMGLAMITCSVIALVVERICYRPFRHIRTLAPLICAIGRRFSSSTRSGACTALRSAPTPIRCGWRARSRYWASAYPTPSPS